MGEEIEQDSEQVARRGLTRRQLLRGMGTGVATLGVFAKLQPVSLGRLGLIGTQPGAGVGTKSSHDVLTKRVLRRDDLLDLTFRFHNLQLDSSDPANPRLVRADATAPAHVVVELAPQNVGEEAIPEPPGDYPEPPIKAVLAQDSRLAFRVPADVAAIPYTVPALLSWADFELSVVAAANGPADGVPSDPGPTETRIEAPWDLILSPNGEATWAHAVEPVDHGTPRTELWHTRLARRGRDGQPVEQSLSLAPIAPPEIRGVWTTGYVFENRPDANDLGPFRMSLKPIDRHDIVSLTARSATHGSAPAEADRLMLSSLGAWMEVEGHWESADVNLLEWRHRSAMGRDTFVKVVRKGFLFPFGHPAVEITITERKFKRTPSGDFAAYLEQIVFLVVRKPVKTYEAFGQPHGGRAVPLREVRITTVTTPPITKETARGDAYWPKVDGQDFQWGIVSRDWMGQRVELTTPLIFVPDGGGSEGARSQSDMQGLVDHYNGTEAPGTIDTPQEATAPNRRTRPLDGQRLAFAPAPGDKPDSTTQETLFLTFGAVTPNPDAGTDMDFFDADQPRFYPTMAASNIRLPAAEAVAKGGQTPPGNPLVILPSAEFIQNSVEDFLTASVDSIKNQGKVYAETLATSALEFAGDKVGAVLTPDFGINALSQLVGPVGGAVTDIANGKFDPASFFDLASAKILGGVSLEDIIGDVESFFEGALNKIPGVTTDIIRPENDPLQPPLKAITKVHWEPDVKSDPLKIFEPSKTEGLVIIDATIVTDFVNPGASTYDLLGSIGPFKANLVGDGALNFIVLHFDHMRFTAKTGAKPNTDVEITKVDFVGPLKFVNELREFMSNVGGSGLSIDVAPTGVTAGFDLAIPTVQVGVFTLQNIVLSAGLTLPFTGQPARVRFAFCSRENPFLLTVSFFGGGGFAAVALGLDGVESLEVSLEFGASASLDIGVASGGVSMMAGVYIKVHEIDDPSNPGTQVQQTELTGFLRIRGQLEVLGLITVSAELYLSFTYESETNKCTGRAKFEVEIEIAFFSTSVSTEVERKFGGEGDPTFQQLMPHKSDWQRYAEAFAA